jgi:hypothetical protein
MYIYIYIYKDTHACTNINTHIKCRCCWLSNPLPVRKDQNSNAVQENSFPNWSFWQFSSGLPAPDWFVKVAVYSRRREIPLMIEAASTSETSANSYQSTRINNLEDSHLHTRRRENLNLSDKFLSQNMQRFLYFKSFLVISSQSTLYDSCSWYSSREYPRKQLSHVCNFSLHNIGTGDQWTFALPVVLFLYN